MNTNPARGESIKAMNDRDGSVDGSYNTNGTLRALGQPRVREHSEGCKESYMTAQIGKQDHVGGNNEYLNQQEFLDEISPRGRNLEKMNVMNFIPKKTHNNERFGSNDSD